jgi:hypothetical protein
LPRTPNYFSAGEWFWPDPLLLASDLFASRNRNRTGEVLEEHLMQAGQFIGVGSFRPQNRGIYGRFKLVSLKEQK